MNLPKGFIVKGKGFTLPPLMVPATLPEKGIVAAHAALAAWEALQKFTRREVVFTEERCSPHALAEARALYANGGGLRASALIVGVTAPTFAEMLRRLGDVVRPAPRWAASARPAAKAVEVRDLRVSGDAAWRTGTPLGRSVPSATRHRVAPPTPPPVVEDVLPIGQGNDQEEWDRCQSWRRMLVALHGVGDVRASVQEFVRSIRRRAGSKPPSIFREVKAAMRDATDIDALYRVCAMSVAALQRVLSSRSSIEAEEKLCDLFRARHRIAPKGFERVGA
jgi:hypothetical protein